MLLLMQAMFWLIAGISAAPFGLAGESHMAALALLTMLFALAAVLCALGVLWRKPRARALVIALEVLCLAGSALLWILPIGFNTGLVSTLVNVALPLTVIVLLRKEDHQAFS